MTAAPAAGPPLSEANILITGGTGSFGQRLLFTLLKQHRPRRVVIFSRDELKQYELPATGGGFRARQPARHA